MICTEQMHSVVAGTMPRSFELAQHHVSAESGAVHGKEYSLLCEAPSDEVRDQWVKAIDAAIQEFTALPPEVRVKHALPSSEPDTATEWVAPTVVVKETEEGLVIDKVFGEPPQARRGSGDSATMERPVAVDTRWHPIRSTCTPLTACLLL